MDAEKKPKSILRHERKSRGWSQQKVADLVETSPDVVSRWERGRTPSLFFQEKLCELYAKTAEELGFVAPQILHSSHELTEYGIIKLTNSPLDRIYDYKNCLKACKGTCFISGTSMVHLSEDSSDILIEKSIDTIFNLLIMDPNWARDNSNILTFLPEKSRKHFHKEISNSIEKFKVIFTQITDPDKFILKAYRTFFPYIITAHENSNYGEMVVEITDYLPEKKQPRFIVQKYQSNQNFFNNVKDKFYSLWNNNNLTSEVDLID